MKLKLVSSSENVTEILTTICCEYTNSYLYFKKYFTTDPKIK